MHESRTICTDKAPTTLFREISPGFRTGFKDKLLKEDNWMTIPLVKRLYLFLITVCLLLTVVPAHSHTLPMGASRWCLGKHGLIANIDLNLGLLSDISGVKEGNYDLAKCSDKELQQIVSEIVQPYINKKLSVTVNGKTYPVKVDKLAKADGNLMFTIWLSVDKVNFDRPENTLKIDYRLLFEETNNTHLNMAFLYETDATGNALQKVFNFSPPKGQFNFQYGSTVWELSVKGPVAEPAATHEKGASRTVGDSVPNKNPGNTSTQKAVSTLPAPEKRSGIPVNSDVKQASAPQNSTLVISAKSKNSQNQDIKGAVPAKKTVARHVEEVGVKGNTPSIWSNIGTFISLGIEHILTGYDHIAFLIGLIVIGLSFREVLKIITAFTIAHSITLLLAAMQVISLNSRFVESVIAFSICYIAVENLFRKKVKYRWVITFCFGLVHGFGFASALQELIVGKSNLILSVVSFNFGVEMGQLMIFFVLLPVLYLLGQKMEFRKVTAAVSMAIFIFGFTWLIERLFGLTLIS
jgi:hydrogenase/urease accessory protein HupE